MQAHATHLFTKTVACNTLGPARGKPAHTPPDSVSLACTISLPYSIGCLMQVWPVRDPGWGEVLKALQASADGEANLKSWFPPASGVLDRIQQICATYPAGFRREGDEREYATGLRWSSPGMQRMVHRRGGRLMEIGIGEPRDLEHADIAGLIEVQRWHGTKLRWKRIRELMKAHMLML